MTLNNLYVIYSLLNMILPYSTNWYSLGNLTIKRVTDQYFIASTLHHIELLSYHGLHIFNPSISMLLIWRIQYDLHVLGSTNN